MDVARLHLIREEFMVRRAILNEGYFYKEANNSSDIKKIWEEKKKLPEKVFIDVFNKTEELRKVLCTCVNLYLLLGEDVWFAYAFEGREFLVDKVTYLFEDTNVRSETSLMHNSIWEFNYMIDYIIKKIEEKEKEKI